MDVLLPKRGKDLVELCTTASPRISGLITKLHVLIKLDLDMGLIWEMWISSSYQ